MVWTGRARALLGAQDRQRPQQTAEEPAIWLVPPRLAQPIAKLIAGVKFTDGIEAQC
jgi:hypothetical protein